MNVLGMQCGGRIEVGEQGVMLLRVSVPSSILVEISAFGHVN